MAEASVGSSENRQSSISDPSHVTTAIIQREIAHLSDRIDLKIEGVLASITARVDAIDKATTVFSENLVRVPTENQKAVGNLQQLHEVRFEALIREMGLSRDVIETRFDGMDRALKLLQDISDRFPERIDEKIASLKEIHGGELEAIQIQFKERDVRSESASASSKLAVDAALQAAKEAVAEQARSAALATSKSEGSQAKAIEQQGDLIASTTGALRQQIDDMKDRITRIEAIAIGQAGQKTDQHTSSSFIISILALVLTLILGAAAFIRTH